ncbi:hypothetical protein ACKWTF_011475 [Chironomus riparius]
MKSSVVFLCVLLIALAVVSTATNPKQQQPITAIERPWAHFAGNIFHNLGVALQNFGSFNGTTKTPSRLRKL